MKSNVAWRNARGALASAKWRKYQYQQWRQRKRKL